MRALWCTPEEKDNGPNLTGVATQKRSAKVADDPALLSGTGLSEFGLRRQKPQVHCTPPTPRPILWKHYLHPLPRANRRQRNDGVDKGGLGKETGRYAVIWAAGTPLRRETA